MFKKLILTSFFLTLCLITFSPILVRAAGLVPDESTKTATSCPPGYVGNCGAYSLNDFIVLGVKISSWILGIVGSLTLLMFIYGGFTYLISAGSSEKIGEATKIITAAVVGLLIVLASFLIIKFVLSSMGLEWNGGQTVTILKTTDNTLTKTDTCSTNYPDHSCMNNTGQTDCKANECLSNSDVNFQCCLSK